MQWDTGVHNTVRSGILILRLPRRRSCPASCCGVIRNLFPMLFAFEFLDDIIPIPPPRLPVLWVYCVVVDVAAHFNSRPRGWASRHRNASHYPRHSSQHTGGAFPSFLCHKLPKVCSVCPTPPCIS